MGLINFWKIFFLINDPKFFILSFSKHTEHIYPDTGVCPFLLSLSTGFVVAAHDLMKIIRQL